MNGSLNRLSFFIVLSIVIFSLFSCGGSQAVLDGSSTTSGTTTTNPTPDTSQTTELEEENAAIPAGYSANNLFVTVPDTIDYLNFTSLFGDHSQKCTFTSSSVVNDLTCVVEVNELAVYFNGLKLQMNVPANQCKYISTKPYWYYNYEVGYGPSNVSITVTKDASGVVQSSSCQVDSSPAQSCSAIASPLFDDVTFDASTDFAVKCRYDTSDETDGKNCCLGKYNLTRTEVIIDGATTTTVERGLEWGGNVKECIGGAGATDWETYNRQGFPVELIERIDQDKSRTKIITVTGPLQTLSGSRSNIPVANFFTPGIHTHSGYGTASGVVLAETATTPARPSPYPYYVDPISDRTGSLIPPGNPFYTFECLDEAFETNFRVRMLVQEWDTVDALTNYITSGVSSPVGADVSGTAPLDCPGQAGEACNQVQDADNFLNAVGGSYNNAVPANRGNYFPKHIY